MAITLVGIGSSTLPVSAPSAKATVTIADAATTAGDTVLITPTSALPEDLKYNHSLYVSEVTGDGFTVSSSFDNLPIAITFDYIIFTGTA